jgi:murein DD-endopeptidase MepM/ murein hydrolase activator NlpD
LKKLLVISFLVSVFQIANITLANAQDEQPEWPVYVVQVGDTLTSISFAFGIPVDDLIEANGISDPNQISVGTTLMLPGIEWVDGVLGAGPMPFGESLRSIARRFTIAAETLGRLNRLASPTQMGFGSQMILPVEQGEPTPYKRIFASQGISLFEHALVSGNNPWVIIGHNSLGGLWDVVDGDVLIVPGGMSTGPSALPDSIVQVEFKSPLFIQGKSIVIEATVMDEIHLSGRILGYDMVFHNSEDGTKIAMQGIPATIEPGHYSLTLISNMNGGERFVYSQTVRIVSGWYGFETINVDPELIDPDLSAKESEQINAIVGGSTEEKYWEDVFVAPSPYDDSISSHFGTRRSYNGGVIDTYHAGVDFGGGLGVEIFAPANGVVVYTGSLDVRGNATIIDHGWGVYTGYWHQSEIYVEVGDEVIPGQVIGQVGNSGRSTGAHLHWEFWVGGVPVNGLDWLSSSYP